CLCDFSVELLSCRTTGNRGILLAFPTGTLQVIKDLKEARVCILYPPQMDLPHTLKLLSATANVLAKAGVNRLEKPLAAVSPWHAEVGAAAGFHLAGGEAFVASVA